MTSSQSVPKEPVRLRTHAKVNLFLRVLGRREDRYHELETILHGISLADEIDVTATDSKDVEIDMELGPALAGDMPEREDNLMWHAARALIAKGAVNRGVRVRLIKHIPIGAGLGGGSGNAAGALVALNELWAAGLDYDDLVAMAASVGSDVPYCIDGGTSLATARGESLTPLPSPAEMWFVLGVSRVPLHTREVYEAWDDLGQRGDSSAAAMTMALGAGDVAEVASLLHNDLEPAAFVLRPELQAKRAALVEAGALGASLSGSGPTVFGVARNEAHAAEVAARVEELFDGVMTLPSAARCIERVS